MNVVENLGELRSEKANLVFRYGDAREVRDVTNGCIIKLRHMRSVRTDGSIANVSVSGVLR